MADYLPDLESTCSALGTNDGAGSYLKDDDCLECVKDLIRFLRRDDGNNHTLRRALGQIGVVNSDLLPILREYPSDDDLFDMVLRLVVNLTSPELLLFKQELPEDKLTRNYFLQLQRFRQDYKRACVNEKLWHVLAQKLGGLLRKDFDERSEDDRLIIERILILVRNILEVPRDALSEKRTENDATVHDQILWVLHKSGMEDLLLYISSSADEAQYCLHVVEIISLMFREQDPKFLASANYQRSMEERKEDETALIRLKKQEEEKKKVKHFQTKSSRHSRFGGSYTITNMKSISENPMIYHKPLSSLHNINFDENKRPKKISKNRETPKDDCKRRSTLAIRLFLKEFCVEFLNGAYNQLMYVVKDNLNRQKAQQNDETYYLWALKFFMEFNRLHNFRVELVSETMSKSTFHYIHQQIEAYKDHYEHEKRNRPMCLTWARRMHLAIKAYQELLLSLVAMSTSKEGSVKQSGLILRSDVFYEQEYRELCLQQLNIYNESKMSLSYLKDLVETTHVFMKLMESMSKSNHLMVKSKKKRKTAPKNKSTSQKPTTISDNPKNNEEVWDEVSSLLSSYIQQENIDVIESPFDAASDTSMEEQKLAALHKIHNFMHQKKAADAVALLRAARNVWPEMDTFGAIGADAEEEFMVLREILFSEIPLPSNIDQDDNQYDQVNPLDNVEKEELGEEEYEEEYIEYSSEREFNFKEFTMRFAVKSVIQTYSLVLANYEKNSDYTNHCVIKMFHRIAWDCGLPSMLYNISIFRSFQKIRREYILTGIHSLKELEKFAKYILSKFFGTCKKNKKVFMEILFWKTSQEALEILEGYGTHTTSRKNKAAYWSEHDEEALERVFHQLKEDRQQQRAEFDNGSENDLLDYIVAHFTESGKSRRQVAKKLKDLNLISDITEVTRKPLKTKGRSWSEEEIQQLKEMYAELKDAIDPVSRIRERLSNQRTKRKIIEKIMELQLCNDLRELKCKTRSRHRNQNVLQSTQSESDSALESSSDESEIDNKTKTSSIQNPSNCDNEPSPKGMQLMKIDRNEVIETIKKLRIDMQPALSWLLETFEEAIENREEEDDTIVPLLSLTDECTMAMENPTFQNFLRILQILPPNNLLGEQYWRIPPTITHSNLTSTVALLRLIAAEGEGPKDHDIDVDYLLQEEKTKKPKRGKDKWIPIRRALDPEAQARINPGKIDSEQSCKAKRKTPNKKVSAVPKTKNKGKGKNTEKDEHSKLIENGNKDTFCSNENESEDDLDICKSTFHVKNSRKKKVLSDSSSSEDERSDAPITMQEKTNSSQSENEDSDADKDCHTSNTLAKRRILDDSSSDEGVIDPYPGEEPRSFSPSSPLSTISRSSITTSSIATPSAKSPKSSTPPSKRHRKSSYTSTP